MAGSRQRGDEPETGVATTNTKERILDVTAELFRHYGYTGTGLKQIVADANAPFGSVYHFFPGGKEQLGVEVIGRSGQMYFELFEAILGSAPDLVTGVADFFAGAAEVLRQTDYADACPIATVALEVASRSEPLRQATASVFDSWITGAAGRFTAAGIPDEPARALAIQMISVLEGAFILCRASRTTQPLEVAGDTATAAVRAALAASAANRH
jgi:AcrR family transcriptional regulator